MRTIDRYTVPADGQPHTVELTSDPFHVAPSQPHQPYQISPTHHYSGSSTWVWLTTTAARPPETIDFWVEHIEGAPTTVREFQVFPDGAEVPDGAVHVGTITRPATALTWHLYELRGDMTATQAECVSVNNYAAPEEPDRDERTRLDALGLAINARSELDYPSAIVDRAETFRAFLAGGAQ
jgi:hypothetical protein